MKKIICLSAIAGSGKTTYAKHYKINHIDENVFIVSSDDIRLELTGKYDNLDHEPEVWDLYYKRINEFRDKNENCTVIADCTNIYNKWRSQIAEIPGFDKRVLVILTKPLDMVLQNNRDRDPAKFVPEYAIISMYERWEMPDEETKKKYDEIIHLDGWFDKFAI